MKTIQNLLCSFSLKKTMKQNTFNFENYFVISFTVFVFFKEFLLKTFTFCKKIVGFEFV